MTRDTLESPGDSVLRDCTLAIQIPYLLGVAALSDCTLAIRISNLSGGGLLRDCTWNTIHVSTNLY